MRDNYSVRKATTTTPEVARSRVQSAYLQYLMRHGVGFEPVGDLVRIHRPNGLGYYDVLLSAFYKDEEARTGVLIRLTVTPRAFGVHVSTASERSIQQRLLTVCHEVVREWDHYLKGVNA